MVAGGLRTLQTVYVQAGVVLCHSVGTYCVFDRSTTVAAATVATCTSAHTTDGWTTETYQLLLEPDGLARHGRDGVGAAPSEMEIVSKVIRFDIDSSTSSHAINA